MRLIDSKSGMELIPEQASLALVGQEVVGRIVVAAGGRPEIFPVNYAMADNNVVFRTAPGTKLEMALRGPVVFEVDRIDVAARAGWSVVIHGRAETVDGYSAPEILRKLSALPVDPWASGTKEFLVRIVPTSITGRRVGITD